MPKTKNYTEEEKDEIIAHVLVQVATGRFISRILAEDEGMCSPPTFWKWVIVDGNEDLSNKLAHARARGIEALLDECGEIADDAINDYVERKRGEETYTAFDKEHVQRSKLRIETRIKLAQMLNPKKYRPGLDVTSGGKELSSTEELEKARLRAQKLLDDKG